ncbi:MAG: LysR family transcriptional regulator [Acidaminococcaceae bacterium]|nr:LysR family transcriptional regulator [Acidaminococcaceae bacterium]
MDVNIQKYQALITTIRAGSITKAAELLNYSQSGVSRMLADLEKEWGVVLLERGKAGVRLTSDGMQLFPYAENIVREYTRLQEQIDLVNGLQRGLIRIGTLSSVAAHWLPSIIKRFQKDYPNIDYVLELGYYTDLEKWLMEGRIDCAFLAMPDNPELETIKLGRDRQMAVLPLKHPLLRYKKIPLTKLVLEPFMLLSRDDNSDAMEIFNRHNLHPQIHFTTWDDFAIMSMVEQGMGVSILPELILQRIPYQIAIRELDITIHRELVLALRSQKDASLAVKKFIEYTKKYAHA